MRIASDAICDELAHIFDAGSVFEKDAAILSNAAKRVQVAARLARVDKMDEMLRNLSIKAYVKTPEPMKKMYHRTEKVLTDPDNTGMAAVGTAFRRITGG